MKEPAKKPYHKHPDVQVRADRPFNAETPLKLLRRSFLTPKNLLYVRSHGSVPEIDPGGYRLTVSGLVKEPLYLSLGEIKNEFSKRELTATLYCAGNRRDELMEVHPMPGKLPWNGGAAGNVRWAGAPLREVLRAAGIELEARHVAFTGLDKDIEGGQGTAFGGSIPIEKGVSADVLLAYEMNGEALAPEHGFPLRAVVGGYIGARSVKWLSSVMLQEGPSNNYYQSREYKLFPPHVGAETADFSKGQMLGEIPLNAVICSPVEGETLTAGLLSVQGYAIAGGEYHVERVEVSADGGLTWVDARLTEDGGRPGSWQFWEVNLELASGQHQIVARATDSAGGTQPENIEEVWNFQGYANNAWHRVVVRLEG
jgi:sulfite oxidase